MGQIHGQTKPHMEMRNQFSMLLSTFVVISNHQGHGLKGGPAKMDGTEFANLDSIARQLAQKMRKKPSIDPLA